MFASWPQRHRNLEELMKQGLFREDLYYRLNVIPLFLPPLRERPEDIPLLVEFFLRHFAARMKKPAPTVSEAAMADLISYTWPGNIRELENLVERAVNLVESAIIRSEHFSITLPAQAFKAPMSAMKGARLEDVVAETEREALLQAVKQYSTSRSLGEALGLSHTAALNKLKKYGISLPGRRKLCRILWIHPEV